MHAEVVKTQRYVVRGLINHASDSSHLEIVAVVDQPRVELLLLFDGVQATTAV